MLDRQRQRHPIGVAHAVAIAFVLLIAVIGAVVLMSREAAGQPDQRPASAVPDRVSDLGIDLGPALSFGIGLSGRFGDADHRRPQ